MHQVIICGPKNKIKKLMKNVFDRFVIERKSLVPRYWSNRELKKFSSIFTGNVVNVSAWKDKDKQGKKYRDYFNNASEYYITNYKTSSRGHQGNIQNEIFLDLEKELDNKLINTFDVVFNHTVLEHIFKIEKAFENLCKLSKDIVIIVIPFLQEQHADYGDYWRMTPLAIKKMFKKNNMSTIYINYNDTSYSSIYIFAIGSKFPDKWSCIKDNIDNKVEKNEFIGTKIIKNSFLKKINSKINIIFNKYCK